jgi:hypothetical protein
VYTPVPPDWTVTACDWASGDGVGGTETLVAGPLVANAAQCASEVVRRYPSASGAPSHGLSGHFHAPLCVSLVVLCTAQTAERGNDFAARGLGATAHVSVSTGIGSAVQSDQCYAEFGMASANGDTNWNTCLLLHDYCTYQDGDGTGGLE